MKNCPICNNKFDKEEFLPRILSTCGHTYCEFCLNKLLCKKSYVIECPTCKSETITLDVNLLTKNLALLEKENKNENYSLKCQELKSHTSGTKFTCPVHLKDIEAFCEQDLAMLCVTCILDNSHKNHDLITINNAYMKVFRRIESTYYDLLKREEDLSLTLKNSKQIKEFHKFQMQQEIINLDNFYFGIINVLKERQILKEYLIKEEYTNKINSIESFTDDISKKLFQIKDFKQFHKDIQSLTQIEFLQASIKNLNILDDTIINEKLEEDNITENRELDIQEELEIIINNLQTFIIEERKNKRILAELKLEQEKLEQKKREIEIKEKQILNEKVEDKETKFNNNNTTENNELKLENYTEKQSSLNSDNSKYSNQNQLYCEIDLEPIMKNRKNTQNSSDSRNDFKVTQNKRVKILALHKKKNKKNESNGLIKECSTSITNLTDFQNSSKKLFKLESINPGISTTISKKSTIKKLTLEKVYHRIDLNISTENNNKNNKFQNSETNPEKDFTEYTEQNFEGKNKRSFTYLNESEIVSSSLTDCKMFKDNSDLCNISNRTEENLNVLLADCIYKKQHVSSKTVPIAPINNINDNKNNQVNRVAFDLKTNLDESSLNFKSFNQDLASLYYSGNNSLILIGGKADNQSRKFCLERNNWSLCDLSVERSDFVAVNYKENKILLIGGKQQRELGSEVITDSIDLMNLKDKTIKKLEIKLKQPRTNFGAAYLASKLYIAGGSNGKEALNSFECFEKRKKTWTDLPKMLTKRKEFCMTFGPDNCIYLIGGSDEKE